MRPKKRSSFVICAAVILSCCGCGTGQMAQQQPKTLTKKIGVALQHLPAAAATGAAKTTVAPEPIPAAKAAPAAAPSVPLQPQVASAAQPAAPSFSVRRDPFHALKESRPAAALEHGFPKGVPPIPGSALPPMPGGLPTPLPIMQEQYRLIGVITGVDVNRALISGPDGQTYVVHQGGPLGESGAIVCKIGAGYLEAAPGGCAHTRKSRHGIRLSIQGKRW